MTAILSMCSPLLINIQLDSNFLPISPPFPILFPFHPTGQRSTHFSGPLGQSNSSLAYFVRVHIVGAFFVLSPLVHEPQPSSGTVVTQYHQSLLHEEHCSKPTRYTVTREPPSFIKNIQSLYEYVMGWVSAQLEQVVAHLPSNPFTCSSIH